MSPESSGDGDGTGLPVLRVAVGSDGVRLWDARAAGVEPLTFSHAEWASFVDGVRRGEFDFMTDSLYDVTPEPLDDNEP